MKNRAFTLIELLVVVLIIGILTAIALPKYQTAVDRSRFSTLMPVAKTIKEAEESYELANGTYTEQIDNLDVQLNGEVQDSVITMANGTKLILNANGGYANIRASVAGMDNRYVMYFKRSLNFPSEIHCEALTSSERAKRLCTSMGGVEYGSKGSYTTYLLEGSGIGQLVASAKKIISTEISSREDRYGRSWEVRTIRYDDGSYAIYDEGGRGTTLYTADGTPVVNWWYLNNSNGLGYVVVYDENGKKQEEIQYFLNDSVKAYYHYDESERNDDSATFDYAGNLTRYTLKSQTDDGDTISVSYNQNGNATSAYNQTQDVGISYNNGVITSYTAYYTADNGNEIMVSYDSSGHPIGATNMFTEEEITFSSGTTPYIEGCSNCFSKDVLSSVPSSLAHSDPPSQSDFGKSSFYDYCEDIEGAPHCQ